MKIKESELRKFIKNMLLKEHFLESENNETISEEDLEEYGLSESGCEGTKKQG